jgi:multidrug resistance efflux pump
MHERRCRTPSRGAGSTHTIMAPFAGVITAVAVAQGDRTAAGATILTVARSGGVVVTVGINPRSVAPSPSARARR